MALVYVMTNKLVGEYGEHTKIYLYIQTFLYLYVYI
jgi:hypothetical protein